MSVVYFYLKFCREEQHARDFVAGRLWMNHLGYFKGLEATVDDGRADRYEGPNSWFQPSQLSEIQFGDIRIPATELAGPVVIQADEFNALNVLCLYAGTSGSFENLSTANLDAFRDYLRVPERCLDMGSVAVMVHNVSAFNDRLIEAVKRENFQLTAGLVTYFDPKAFSGHVTNPIFAKRREFDWQREYRFALNRDNAEGKILCA